VKVCIKPPAPLVALGAFLSSTLVLIVNLDKSRYNFYIDPLGESNFDPFQRLAGFFLFQGTPPLLRQFD
jgi:hypothetical protein